MDIAAAVAEIIASNADIAQVGTAVFGVYVGIKVAKWIRRVL
ncbi:major capsid protein [Schlegelella sp. S2-27]|uniref:Major capsid protein n=1 Tax=Caldimonas mangrovi TaxID=2944811 RepID=A0ABT0YT54_9BURK|nr:major capsid protein [Caldimonas mangrovi]MCM5681911.1 major capsid protein [Caldimonas mangrovi]